MAESALVDTIFTHEVIEKRIKETGDKEGIGSFVHRQKGALDKHLEKTAKLAIAGILTDLDTTLP